MSTSAEEIAAAGAAAEAQARARDAADAAVADAAMASGSLGDEPAAAPVPNTALTNAPQPGQPPVRRDLTRIGGDATGDMLTDDFGLDGDLRSTMDRALEQAFAEQLKDDSTADTAATPAPAQPSDASAASEDGAGGGGAAGAASAEPPVPGTPPVAPAADQPFDLNAYARDYFGTDLTRQQSAELFAVLGGMQSASPEQRQQIDAILSGRQVQYQPPQFQPTDQPTAPGAAEVAIPGLPPRPPDTDYEAQQLYDRYIAPLATAQASQVESLRADIARTTAQQQADQRAQSSARIDQAAASWRSAHPILSDGEFDALTQRIVASQTFPALVTAHHGDVNAATNAAYEQHFWSDPALRDRAMANAASGRDPMTALPDAANPTAADQAALEAGRRALAGSVAGGGGHAPVRTPPAPRTKAERQSAMTEEIAAHMAGPVE